jgi:hypothetical protein
MFLNQPLGFGDLLCLEAVVGKQLDRGFNPVFGLAVRVLDVDGEALGSSREKK